MADQNLTSHLRGEPRMAPRIHLTFDAFPRGGEFPLATASSFSLGAHARALGSGANPS
jgi:hypothetical protein